MIRRAMWLGLIICLLPLVGCVTVDREQPVEALPSPWPEQDAPTALTTLAEDLQAFQATIGHLPENLAQLDRSGIATSGASTSLGYVYHPSGIGILRDSWRLILADDRMRQAGKVWCIVRPPVVLRGSPALRVVEISMAELREAAAAAGGLR